MVLYVGSTAAQRRGFEAVASGTLNHTILQSAVLSGALEREGGREG